jgi:hypothetical protein
VSNWPALAAAIGGPAVGIAGVVFGWLNSKSERETTLKNSAAQREHERELARDERLHDELREAYEELLGFFRLLGEVVGRTRPMLSPAPAPPSLPGDDELRRIFARASVIGSEEAMDAVKEGAVRYRAFLAAAWTLDDVEKQGGDKTGLWQAIQTAREQFTEQVDLLEKLIRSETRR